MKKILLLLLVIVSISTYGQLEYTLAKSTSTYTPLTSPTVLTSAWTQTFITKMPFKFTYFGRSYDSLGISPNAIAFTTNDADLLTMGQEDYYYQGELYPVGAEISYLITGTTPNRIIKVQFKNLRANTPDTSAEYTINNQIWVYETGDKFEFHIGPNVITDLNVDKFYFGFIDYDNSPYLAVTGTITSPTLARVTNATTFPALPSHPTNGTVYTFEPYVAPSKLSEIVKPYNFTNTASGFSIAAENMTQVIVTNALGQQILNTNLTVGETFDCHTAELSKGMYVVSIFIKNQTFFEKIIVQ